MSLLTGHFLSKKLLVPPRFCNHLTKHSLAQAGLKRSLCILQQLYHCLFMSAARSASLFFWILVNRKNRGRLYRFVNLILFACRDSDEKPLRPRDVTTKPAFTSLDSTLRTCESCARTLAVKCADVTCSP